MRPQPLLKLRRIRLDPAVNGRVVNQDAAVSEHQLEVAVADREPQVPAHRPEDHLGRKLPTLEQRLPIARYLSAPPVKRRSYSLAACQPSLPQKPWRQPAARGDRPP